MSNSCDPVGVQPVWLHYPGDFLGNNTQVGCHFLFQGNLPDQGIEFTSRALADRFLTAEPPGKPQWVHRTLEKKKTTSEERQDWSW